MVAHQTRTWTRVFAVVLAVQQVAALPHYIHHSSGCESVVIETSQDNRPVHGDSTGNGNTYPIGNSPVPVTSQPQGSSQQDGTQPQSSSQQDGSQPQGTTQQGGSEPQGSSPPQGTSPSQIHPGGAPNGNGTAKAGGKPFVLGQGTSPTAVVFSDGTIVASYVDTKNNSIECFRSTDHGASWNRVSPIVLDTDTSDGSAKGKILSVSMLRFTNDDLQAAVEISIPAGASSGSNGNNTKKDLQTFASDDKGNIWGGGAKAITYEQEDFLGFTDPYFRATKKDELQLFYTRIMGPNAARIEMRNSSDSGSTWSRGQEVVVVPTSNGTLPGGFSAASVGAVGATSLQGAFVKKNAAGKGGVVFGLQSSDDGASWTATPQKLYAPQAGAVRTALANVGGKLIGAVSTAGNTVDIVSAPGQNKPFAKLTAGGATDATSLPALVPVDKTHYLALTAQKASAQVQTLALA